MKKESSNKEKENITKPNEKKVHNNKYAIILDNVALKLDVKDKKDIINVLKEKINYLKTHNMPKYLEIIGQNV